MDVTSKSPSPQPARGQSPIPLASPGGSVGKSGEAIFLAAIQHHQAGRLREAEAGFLNAINLDPAYAEAWQRLGIVYQQSGRTGQAIEALSQAARLKPGAADIQSNFGTVLAAGGQWGAALEAFATALRLAANFPETHHNIGNVLSKLGRAGEAVAAYREAVGLRPEYADAWHRLGELHWAGRDLDGALEAFEKAVSLRPQWVEALNNLGGVLQERRHVDLGVGMFRRAIEVRNEPRVWDNLLLAIHGQGGVGAREILNEHLKWNLACAAPLMRGGRAFSNDRSGERRLRVGYISPDFREHPVGRLMTPVLEDRDHQQFEIVCYSDVGRADEITAGHRRCADAWVDIASMSDEAVTERIENDRIDVLIELALHTANNRLLVLARNPAPVQMTWAGYPGTTGLRTIDFRLSDPQLDPAGESRDELYTEKTLRLPNCFWCFDPRSDEPGVSELPAERNRHITLGCLNQFGKITDATLGRWGRVMELVPGSRMRLLAPRGGVRDELVNRMKTFGVEEGRIDFVDRCPREDYLRLYHGIDVCLDTFPYTGHTTSIDALWMGVPVVTRFGETAVSRGGLSILSQVGLADLAVETDGEFVRTAAGLANDVDRLRNLRTSLRDQLMGSPVANCRQFTRGIEDSIRFAWKTWVGN